MRLLFLNGAIRGAGGNTARALALAEHHALSRSVDVDVLHLADFVGDVAAIVARVRAANGLIVGSGVYWSSWGSPLQRFLEVMTPYEATDVFVGKSVGAVLTMDSVGGTDVAARMVFTLGLLGCVAPPFPAVVLSRMTEAHDDDDVWQPHDLRTLVDNVCAQAAQKTTWASWPVTPAAVVDGPWPLPGRLDLGLPDFLLPTTKMLKTKLPTTKTSSQKPETP